MSESHVPHRIVEIFSSYPEVQIAYLFGSRANAKSHNKNSDWDFAVLFERSLDPVRAEFLKYELQAKISSMLGTDHVDMVNLNHCKSVELTNAVIRDGICFIDRHPNRDTFEMYKSHEYQDHKAALSRNGHDGR